MRKAQTLEEDAVDSVRSSCQASEVEAGELVMEQDI